MSTAFRINDATAREYMACHPNCEEKTWCGEANAGMFCLGDRNQVPCHPARRNGVAYIAYLSYH
ncbi:hypothetical protein IG631_03506 [Alternaria alternata]|nr:hypothetical protein IG631_03506 [Alternaria alternata]